MGVHMDGTGEPRGIREHWMIYFKPHGWNQHIDAEAFPSLYLTYPRPNSMIRSDFEGGLILNYVRANYSTPCKRTDLV
jgi:hypothetical protein